MFPDAQQPCSSTNLCSRHRFQVVDLHFHRGDWAQATEVPVKRDADGGIGERRQNATVEGSVRVEQVSTKGAFDADSVGVEANDTNSKHAIERHLLDEGVDLGQRQIRQDWNCSIRYDRAMEILDKVVVVTGGGNGIGRALCRRFAAEGAAFVAVVDCDAKGAEATAREIENGRAYVSSVDQESDVAAVVNDILKRHGRIDLFCSNAGIGIAGGEEVDDRDWQRIWEVNVMAHVYAARAVLPSMLSRKEGYLLQTVSAAGLLTQIGSAPYAVTKHAALSFAEWLGVTYGDRGLKVSALCPQGVRTRMLEEADFGNGEFLKEGALEPEEVAEAVVRGLRAENFLILPHPEVAEYFRRKAGDYDRWLRGMRKLQASVQSAKMSN